MKVSFARRFCAKTLVMTLAAVFSMSARSLYAQVKLGVDWNAVETVSKTTPTLQVVVNPMLRTHSPIHDSTFEALRNLGADFVRYVPWFPYPRMVVAELEPPTK